MKYFSLIFVYLSLVLIGSAQAGSCSPDALFCDADCSSAAISGNHSGSFSAKGMRIRPGADKNISGTWIIKIDPKTCAIEGSVTSEFFGNVRVSGSYGAYKPITSTFDATNIFFQEAAGVQKFTNFAFVGTDVQDQYVGIANQEYSYKGRFTVDH